MKCSIIIRAYNEEKHLNRLLTGIMRQTIKDVEIILVDSGSTDGTRTIAAQYPVTILHIHPDQFTFGRSLNHGITHARSELIVIASAHVYPVYPDWLESLLAPFVDSQVALTFGKQRGDEKTNFSERQVFSQWFPEQSMTRQSYPFCNNANAAIRRSFWELHTYDESLTGLEDLEWAHWAIDNGHFISYASEAEVIHVHSEAPHDVYNRYLREGMAFKRIFPQQSFHLGDFLRLVLINIANDARQARRLHVLLACLKSIIWFRGFQFWGTYQGFRHSGPVTKQLRKTFYYPNTSSPIEEIGSRVIEPIQYHD